MVEVVELVFDWVEVYYVIVGSEIVVSEFCVVCVEVYVVRDKFWYLWFWFVVE